MPLTTYVSDKGCDFTRLPVFFALGLPGAAVLAMVYQTASYYMPCVGWVTALLMLAYAGGMLFLLNFAGEFSRNRNLWIHLAASFFVCSFGYYICWCTFFTLLLQTAGTSAGGPPPGIVWNPIDIADYIPRFAEIGYTTRSSSSYSSSSSSGSNVSGIMLWICWVIEAGVILFAPPFVSMGYLNNPFFVRSNSWGKKRKIARTFKSDTAPRLARSIMDDESFAWMRDLRPGAGIGAIGFELIEHPSEEQAYLTVTRGVEKVENKKRVIKQEPIVSHIELSPTHRNLIEGYFSEIGARSAAATPGARSDRDEEIEAAPGWDAGSAAPAAARRPSARPAPAGPAGDSSEPEVDPDTVAKRQQAARTQREAAGPAARPAPSGIKPRRPSGGTAGGAKKIDDEWDK